MPSNLSPAQWRKQALSNNPNTMASKGSFVAGLGFAKETPPASQKSRLKTPSGVEIHDAKPDNVIFDKAGNMFPFDVWINDPNDTFGVLAD